MKKAMKIVKFSIVTSDVQVNTQKAQYIISKQLKYYTQQELSQKLKIEKCDIQNLMIIMSMVKQRDGVLII